MNKQTKIFFSALLMAVAIAVGNVIAKGSVDAGDAAPSSISVKETKTKTKRFATKTKTETKTKTKRSATKTKTETVAESAVFPEELLPVVKGDTRDMVLLRRSAYTLLYNKATRLPVWVAWHLTREHVNGQYKREGIKFAEDEDVPMPRATNMDYVNSGYDRGHMCPSGDNRWSERAQVESFLYTNCCPQLHNLNAGDWNELESQCREWAKEYGDVYIVCGPLLLNKKHKTIGKNRVVVPEAFFKVVFHRGRDAWSKGFVYRNEVTNKKMSAYQHSVEEVERLTGISIFH